MKIYSYSFSNLANYRSKGKIEEAERAYERLVRRIQKLKPGDEIELGYYLLPGGCKPNLVNIKMPASWYVLHREGTRVLLLSRYCLDWEFFDGSGPLIGPAPDTQWSRSYLRKWLNGEFWDSAFAPQEKQMILETEVKTEDNSAYGTRGGEDTRDRLFLLSAREAEQYLQDRELAVGEILYADSSWEEAVAAELTLETYCWWLRTTGGTQSCVAVVGEDGGVDLYGVDSDADEVGVRPAMWIDISKLK